MSDMFPLTYDRCGGPSGGPQPGCKVLMKISLDHFGATNLGIYNPRPIRGGLAWSKHACGEAGDSGYPYTVGGTSEGWRFANWLMMYHRELGVQQIIYAKKVWRNTRDSEGWRAYGGTAAHYEHVHWELTRQAARELTTKMVLDRTNLLEEDMDVPGEAVEAMLIERVEQMYQLIADREPDLPGQRWWCGRIIEAYRNGDDVTPIYRELETALLTEVPAPEREQLALLMYD